MTVSVGSVPRKGQIGAASEQSLPSGNIYTIKYRYYPIFGSNLVNGEDGNLVFDGIRVFVQEDELDINVEESRFVTNPNISVIANPFFFHEMFLNLFSLF